MLSARLNNSTARPAFALISAVTAQASIQARNSAQRSRPKPVSSAVQPNSLIRNSFSLPISHSESSTIVSVHSHAPNQNYHRLRSIQAASADRLPSCARRPLSKEDRSPLRNATKKTLCTHTRPSQLEQIQQLAVPGSADLQPLYASIVSQPIQNQ
jgi:hypothetical protein